jgi:hypothetical protein
MKITFGILLVLLSMNSCKNKPICVINENSSGKAVYDLDEASCFIALKLGKKKTSDLSLIREALVAEENYIYKIGLISEDPNPQKEPDSNAVLDINELVEYALKTEGDDLTEDELLEIYDTETEYLKIIGVMGE